MGFNDIKKLLNYDDLYELYISKSMSSRQIGKIYDCSHTVINRLLREYNITVRNAHDKKYYGNRNYKKAEIHESKSGYLEKGKIRQHRHVMEQHLNRKLTSDEVIHHVDFNKSNNDINNLFLFENQPLHVAYHQYIKNNNYISPQEFMDFYGSNIKNTLFSKDWLYVQYVELNKSANQISREMGFISRSVIVKYLKKYEIWDMKEHIKGCS